MLAQNFLISRVNREMFFVNKSIKHLQLFDSLITWNFVKSEIQKPAELNYYWINI